MTEPGAVERASSAGLSEEPRNYPHRDESPSDDLVYLAMDKSMPIAIVGIGFRGPGEATDVEKLSEMILAGREAWSPIPEERWNTTGFYHPDHSQHGTVSANILHYRL